MDQLLAQFGQTLQGVVDSPIVQVGARAIGLYVVLLWLGSAFWAFRDASHRSHNLLAPYAAGALIILATPVFFPFALILYAIVRPGETLVEAWERRMAEEAAAEAIPLCSSCGRRTDPDWLACPSCGQRLHRRCAVCGRLMGLDWNLCAWCGSEPSSGVVALPLSVADERERAFGDRPSASAATATRRSPADTRRSERTATRAEATTRQGSLHDGGRGDLDATEAVTSDAVAAFAPSHTPID